MKIAFLLLTLLPAVTPAQETTPLVRSNTRVVLLDVVVTDKSGNPVRALNQSDFTILEDGKPQKISSFEPPPSSSSAVLPTSPRTIILLDELNSAFADLSYARDKILGFLAQHNLEQTPTALMALNLQGISVLEDYTLDANLLKEKLTHLHLALLNPPDGPTQQAKIEEHAQTSIDSLVEIAGASLGSSYNLNIVWVTSGMAGGLKDTGRADGTRHALERLADLLMRARIRLYSIDPSGVHPLPVTVVASPAGEKLTSSNKMAGAKTNDDLALLGTAYEANDFLNRLTSMTGGHAYYMRNDIEIALSEAVHGGAANYSISYSPQNGDFNGEYRTIEVHTSAEGTTAHTRRGYYAVADEMAPSQEMREARWRAALVSPLTYAAFVVSCSSNYDANTGRATGAFTVKPTPLIMETEPQSREIIRVAALSRSGAITANWSWQIDWKKTWTNRVTSANFDKVLPKKTQRLKFLVSDPGSLHIGTCDYLLH
jgi:VWFA-related protein